MVIAFWYDTCTVLDIIFYIKPYMKVLHTKRLYFLSQRKRSPLCMWAIFRVLILHDKLGCVGLKNNNLFPCLLYNISMSYPYHIVTIRFTCTSHTYHTISSRSILSHRPPQILGLCGIPKAYQSHIYRISYHLIRSHPIVFGT